MAKKVENTDNYQKQEITAPMSTIAPVHSPSERAYDDVPDPEHAPGDYPAHQAYLHADALTFRGRPLKPFGPRRMAAAQCMGLHLWKLTPEQRAAAATFDADGKLEAFSYDGIYLDSLTVVYLCSCPNSDVLLATQQRDTVTDKVLDWADEQGVRMDDPELIACFASIIGQLAASASEPAPSKDNTTDGSASGNG